MVAIKKKPAAAAALAAEGAAAAASGAPAAEAGEGASPPQAPAAERDAASPAQAAGAAAATPAPASAPPAAAAPPPIRQAGTAQRAAPAAEGATPAPPKTGACVGFYVHVFYSRDGIWSSATSSPLSLKRPSASPNSWSLPGAKPAKKVPHSFLEIIDCLVDVLLRYQGPPADVAAPAAAPAGAAAAAAVAAGAGAGGAAAPGSEGLAASEVQVVANADGSINLLPTPAAAVAAAERKVAEAAERGQVRACCVQQVLIAWKCLCVYLVAADCGADVTLSAPPCLQPLTPAQKDVAVQCFALKLLSGAVHARRQPRCLHPPCAHPHCARTSAPPCHLTSVRTAAVPLLQTSP